MAIAKTRRNVYKALRRQGAAKGKAARIANAGVTRAGRVRMARKAAATRRKRGRR